MPKVSLKDAQPGQKVAKAVTTRTGLIMVQPGAELTTSIIERLRNLGIDAIFVEGAKLGPDKPLDESLKELDDRFTGHEDNSWMMALKRIVAQQLKAAATEHD